MIWLSRQIKVQDSSLVFWRWFFFDLDEFLFFSPPHKQPRETHARAARAPPLSMSRTAHQRSLKGVNLG